jgi:hypothetical protein
MATASRKSGDSETLLLVSDEEKDTILAALRCYQIFFHEGFPDGVEEIATNEGKHEAMEPDAVDTLCESINTEAFLCCAATLSGICGNPVEHPEKGSICDACRAKGWLKPR